MKKQLSYNLIVSVLLTLFSFGNPSTHHDLEDVRSYNNLIENSNDKVTKSYLMNLKELGTIGNKTFYIETNLRTTWFEAWELCRSSGFVLAVIENQAENAFIADYLNVENLVVYAIWTSGTDLGRNGTFYWMGTGKEIEYTNWSIEYGQPDDGGTGRSCIYGFGPEFQWMDLSCDLRTVSVFICQS